MFFSRVTIQQSIIFFLEGKSPSNQKLFTFVYHESPLDRAANSVSLLHSRKFIPSKAEPYLSPNMSPKRTDTHTQTLTHRHTHKYILGFLKWKNLGANIIMVSITLHCIKYSYYLLLPCLLTLVYHIVKDHKATCVPAVSATCPGKFRVERKEQIQESPSQYDDVVYAGV